MFLNRALALDVDVVELDAAVVGLARRHFGFIDCADSPRLTVRGWSTCVVPGLEEKDRVLAL